RLHPGLGDRRQPLPRPATGRRGPGGHRLRQRRAARRLPPRARGSGGARPFLPHAPAMSVQAREIAVESADGHRWTLLARIPDGAKRSLLWLPALGIAARHYVPFAEALAARGVAVFVHEWRGNGSSSLRAARHCDWGYRELLELDIPASHADIEAELPGLARAIGGHSLGGQLACCQL